MNKKTFILIYKFHLFKSTNILSVLFKYSNSKINEEKENIFSHKKKNQNN